MEAELIAQAEIGDEAKKFLGSDLGKCLVGIANQEADLAAQQLENIDPTNADLIRDCQYRIKFGRSFERWLHDLIADGDNALSVLKQSMEKE